MCVLKASVSSIGKTEKKDILTNHTEKKSHIVRSVFFIVCYPTTSSWRAVHGHQEQDAACHGIKPHELIDNNACIMNDLIGRIGLVAHDRVLASF